MESSGWQQAHSVQVGKVDHMHPGQWAAATYGYGSCRVYPCSRKVKRKIN